MTQIGFAFWFVWPDTTFNALPGDEAFAVFAIRPVDATTSSFEGHLMSTTGESNPERRADAANVLAPEDIALCESVRRGLMRKGYDQRPIIAATVPRARASTASTISTGWCTRR